MTDFYEKAKTNNTKDFILAFRDLYLEILWDNEAYVKNTEKCNYALKNKFEEIVITTESKIDKLKSVNINVYYRELKEEKQISIDKFELNLTKEDLDEIDFLKNYINTINEWLPKDENLIKFRKEVIYAIEESIGYCNNDTYLNAKSFNIEHLKTKVEREIELLEYNLELMKKHAVFSKEFQRKEKEYLLELKKSL